MSKAKRCRSCSVELTPENAYINRKRGTYQSACKSCGSEYAKRWRSTNKDRENARARSYYETNKTRLRVVYDRSRVLRKYGLTPEEIEGLRVAQNGLCPICLERPATAVDHCHSTGRVRGLLCNPCNTTLGFMRDDPAKLRRAADYLEVVHELRQVLCVKG